MRHFLIRRRRGASALTASFGPFWLHFGVRRRVEVRVRVRVRVIESRVGLGLLARTSIPAGTAKYLNSLHTNPQILLRGTIVK